VIMPKFISLLQHPTDLDSQQRVMPIVHQVMIQSHWVVVTTWYVSLDNEKLRTLYSRLISDCFIKQQAYGGAAADIIYGGDGQDIIFGDFGYYNAETEILPNQFYTSISEHFAAAGNDAIYGGNDDDFLYGQEVSTQIEMCMKIDRITAHRTGIINI